MNKNEDDRKPIDYEMMFSINKSLKIKQLKLLHKRAESPRSLDRG